MEEGLDSLLEVLKRIEDGKDVGEAWIRGHYPESWPQILDAIRIEGALAPPPFDRLGPYAIREFLGRGPNGTVYRARAVEGSARAPADRDVALKVIHLHAAGDSGPGGASEAALRVRHPDIVPCLDVGAAGTGAADLAYLVTELVEGTTLRELLEAGIARPAETCRAVAATLGRALGAIHETLPAHGHLKPENVTRDRRGRFRLMDTGLSSLVRNGREREEPADAPYQAPELLEGGAPGPRSDLFALGAILSEILTSPSGRGPPPDSLVGLVERLTAAEPARRFGSAAEFLPALDRPQASR